MFCSCIEYNKTVLSFCINIFNTKDNKLFLSGVVFTTELLNLFRLSIIWVKYTVYFS